MSWFSRLFKKLPGIFYYFYYTRLKIPGSPSHCVSRTKKPPLIFQVFQKQWEPWPIWNQLAMFSVPNKPVQLSLYRYIQYHNKNWLLTICRTALLYCPSDSVPCLAQNPLSLQYVWIHWKTNLSAEVFIHNGKNPSQKHLNWYYTCFIF